MATRTYDDLNAEAMRHYQDQDYAAALELLDREGDQYPEMAHMVYYLRSCMLRSCMAVRVGKPGMAVRLIEEALHKGFFYSERTMRDSPSWEPLQGTPEFERLVEICKARQAEAPADAVLLTAEPEGGCREDSPCPALVALHGNGSEGPSALAGWRAVVSQGWDCASLHLAAIQSSQVAATKTYLWDDEETAMRDIEAKYAELSRLHAIDTGRVVIAGFSLEGETALRAALSGAIPVRGFILLGPGGPTIDTPEAWGRSAPTLISQGAERNLRWSEAQSYVLLGEADAGVPHDAIRTLVELLNANGVPCDLEMLPGLAHDYPPEPGPVLSRALGFIG